MEDYSHSFHRNQASATLSKKISNGSGFTAKTVYDDVFGGQPKFGVPTFMSRIEDYSDIFGSSHSSRGSSIPILDLPVVDEGDVSVDVRSSNFDYLEVFGGFNGFDSIDSFEKLFSEPQGGESSTEEEWTLAETGSPSEGSNADAFACSEKNPFVSNGAFHNSFDGKKQFNVSYHKTYQRGEEDGTSGITHIAQLHAVPGFSFVVNESTLQKTEGDKPPPQRVDSLSFNVDFNGGLMEGKSFGKTISHSPTFSAVTKTSDSDLKPQSGGHGSNLNKPFLSVSEISLRTQPSQVLPPLRPPPKIATKECESKTMMSSNLKASENYSPEVTALATKECESKTLMSSNLKASGNYGLEVTAGDSSPFFFDVEVDASSSAAASAAAMKEAMEKAQARLKRAKELMERKRDGPQSWMKLGLKDDLKGKERKEGKAAYEAHRFKEEGAQETSEREDIGMKAFAREEGKKATRAAHVAPDFEEKGKYFNVAKESVEQKPGKESRSAQETHSQEGAGEWKAEMQFYELVKTDKLREAPEVLVQAKNGKILVPPTTTKAQGYEQSEKKAANRVYEQQEENDKKSKAAKEAHEQEENVKNVEAAQKAHEWEEHEKKLKVAQEISDQDENEKKLKAAHEQEASEKKPKEARKWDKHEKKLKEAHEWKQNVKIFKETHEKEENEKRLKEAREWEENEKRLNEAREQEENEKRQKEAREREEYEKRLNEAREWEENEKRIKEAHERKENKRRQKEARKREENDKKLKEAREMFENENRLKESREQGQNEKKLRSCEQEENEKRLKEAHEEEGNEKQLKELSECVENRKGLREAYEQEENEKRQKEACEKEEDEKKLKADQEAHEHRKEKNVMAANEACKQDNGRNFKATLVTHRHEEKNGKLKASQNTIGHEESSRMTNGAKDSCKPEKNGKEQKAAKVENELDERGVFKAAYVALGALEHDRSANKMKDVIKAFSLDDSEKRCREFKVAINLDHNENNKKISQVGCDRESLGKAKVSFDPEDNKNGNRAGQGPVNLLEEKGKMLTTSQEVNTSQYTERKEKNHNETCTTEEREKEERLQREIKQEEEHLSKLQEEREREREREKDRMAVERATCEARERAERAAVERATGEARQRAMAEAQERLAKASAEAREKSLAEKAFMEARVRAERAAVERAIAEARERAVERAMVEKAALESREKAERSFPEKFSATTSSDSGNWQNSSFSDQRGPHFQSSDSSITSRCPNSSNHDASDTNKFQETEGESALRCKARLERHQRTVARAAKALAEKNMRDLLAQREQAVRNRLAETLDADVRRWSSGKEGNLRALLSTLQYILGPDSGWQPIPLTDVITAVSVKKAYRKATLCVHPDKLQQRGASIQHKYICEKVFDLLKEAWNKFNSEGR